MISITETKKKEQAEIAQLTKEYLKKGNKITILPPCTESEHIPKYTRYWIID